MKSHVSAFCTQKHPSNFIYLSVQNGCFDFGCLTSESLFDFCFSCKMFFSYANYVLTKKGSILDDSTYECVRVAEAHLSQNPFFVFLYSSPGINTLDYWYL